MMPRWKTALFYGLSCLATFVLVELILNLLYGRPLVYAPDPAIIYRPIPNQYGFPSRYHLPRAHINAWGTRGKELQPAPAKRVLLLGDSHAFGVGLRDDETFAAQLERHLATTGGAVEVVNCGVGGYGLFQEVGLFKARDLALKPDSVVLLYSLSQIYRQPITDAAKSAYHRFGLLRYLTSYHVFATLYIEAFANLGIRVYSIPVERENRRLQRADRFPRLWEKERPYFEDLFQTCRSRKIDVALIVHGTLDDPDRYVETQLTELCHSSGVPLLRFNPANLSSEYYVPRDGHFSKLYYARLLQAFSDAGWDGRLLALGRPSPKAGPALPNEP